MIKLFNILKMFIAVLRLNHISQRVGRKTFMVFNGWTSNEKLNSPLVSGFLFRKVLRYHGKTNNR